MKVACEDGIYKHKICTISKYNALHSLLTSMDQIPFSTDADFTSLVGL